MTNSPKGAKLKESVKQDLILVSLERTKARGWSPDRADEFIGENDKGEYIVITIKDKTITVSVSERWYEAYCCELVTTPEPDTSIGTVEPILEQMGVTLPAGYFDWAN